MKKSARRSRLRLVFKLGMLAIAAVLAFFILSLAALRFIDPPTTTVQMQRRIEGIMHPGKYTKRQSLVPLSRISTDLQHAVIAAEDGRFYQHSGIDWQEVRIVVEEAREGDEPLRGASTITQQLVKNLFFTTHRNPLRKIAEYPLAPLADTILGKQRVLELYLNVVEWGPGVFGAEAAARYHFRTSASKLTREQAARLAAILPSPIRRKPARMNQYSQAILQRMRQMGW